MFKFGKPKNKKCEVHTIKAGNCFEYEDKLYMVAKIPAHVKLSYNDMLVILLTEGLICPMDRMTEVYPVTVNAYYDLEKL